MYPKQRTFPSIKGSAMSEMYSSYWENSVDFDSQNAVSDVFQYILGKTKT